MSIQVRNRASHIARLHDMYRKAELSRGTTPLDSGLAPSDLAFLNGHHYLRLRSFFTVTQMHSLNREVEAAFSDYAHVAVAKRARKVDAHSLSLEHIESAPRLSDPEMKLGADYWRQETSYVQLKEPLRVIPSLLPILLDERVLAVAQSYLGAFPMLNFVKVQRTWANALPETDTQLWHIDLDAYKILKLFIFLQDTNIDIGATQFIQDTHLFEGPRAPAYKDRWSDEEVRLMYPSELLLCAETDLGDAFFLDTNMVHRGSRPKTGDRTVVIANFGLHAETVSGGVLELNPEQKDLLSETQLRALT